MTPESKKTIIGGLVLLVAFLGIFFVVFFMWIPELFLVKGGQDFILMEHNQWGTYRVSGSSVPNWRGTTVEVQSTGPLTAMMLSYPLGAAFNNAWVAMTYVREGNGPDWTLASDTLENVNPALKMKTVTRSYGLQGALHRFDDPSILDYYAMALPSGKGTTGTTDPAKLLPIVERLLKAHPDDLYVKAVYLNALMRSGEDKQLEQKIALWGADFDRLATPALAQQFELARRFSNARKLSRAGRNGCDRLAEIMNAKRDLPSRLKDLPSLLDYDDGLIASDFLLVSNGAVPDVGQAQVAVKAIRVSAELMFLKGESAQALDLLAACYRVGQLYGRGAPNPLRSLFAVAIRSIASGGLNTGVLDGCETVEDLDKFWPALQKLQAFDQASRPSVPSVPGADMVEAETRLGVANARFELVRMVAAARRHLLSDKDFPTSAGDFAPFLPDGPPADPFTSAPLRYTRSGEDLLCYSVGPDAIDQQATIAYDPTNGSLSAGDLITTVPRERAVPFPRGGVRANNRADFMRQFPNGLPVDPFADKKGTQYSVSDSEPVTVYSFGPDTDQEKILPLQPKYTPSVQYDPTNGTLSAGDIFVTIPAAGR